MVRLRHADLRRLLAVAAELATVTGVEEVARTVHRETHALLPADRFSYNEISVGEHGRTKVDGSFHMPYILPPPKTEIFNHFFHEHPCLASFRQPDGRAVKISDFSTLRQFRQLGLYQEFFKPLGDERQLSIAFAVGAGRTITVGFNRRGRDYCEEQRIMLNLLSSHIARAHHRARLLTRVTKPYGQGLDVRAEGLRRLGLTEREAEVLVWISEGKTNPEIGLILKMSRSTVKTHLQRIFCKLGCETRTAAARTALEVLYGHPTTLAWPVVCSVVD